MAPSHASASQDWLSTGLVGTYFYWNWQTGSVRAELPLDSKNSSQCEAVQAIDPVPYSERWGQIHGKREVQKRAAKALKVVSLARLEARVANMQLGLPNSE